MVTEANYSAEQTTEILAQYAAGATVEMLADTHGRSTRSITAKLVKEGVYIPKPKKQARPKKAELIAEVETTLRLTPSMLESLEKASYDALSALHEAVSNRCGLGPDVGVPYLEDAATYTASANIEHNYD